MALERAFITFNFFAVISQIYTNVLDKRKLTVEDTGNSKCEKGSECVKHQNQGGILLTSMNKE